MAGNEREQQVTAYGSSVDEDANSNHASFSNQNIVNGHRVHVPLQGPQSGHQTHSGSSVRGANRIRQESTPLRRVQIRNSYPSSTSSAGGDSTTAMMSSTIEMGMPMGGPDGMPEGLLQASGQSGNKMTNSTCSLTDITLDQAVYKLQEIERENVALRDNLRQHNAIVKKQYEALAEWRKKETEKFEQTKALITALRAENQELQVKVMTLTDKEKELSQRVQSLDEDRAHLMRKKAMADQRVINVYKKAEEQGVTGLAREDLDENQDVTDAVVFVTTTDKEEIIQRLEADVAGKDDVIAQLRADILKKDQEVAKFRESTKQLLKDMESQQRLKENIEEENRHLTKQIMQAEQKLHKQMQSVIATTKREMQAEQMYSTATALTTTTNTATTATSALAGAGSRLQRFKDGVPADNLSFPEDVEDLVGIARSLELRQQEEMTFERLKRRLEEESKEKEGLKSNMEKLQSQFKDLTVKYEGAQKDLQAAQKQAADTADELAQEYDKKLMEMTQYNRRQESQGIQPSETEDNSILRSQVLTLIREVDEAQNKLSAAMGAINHKDSRIAELDQMNQSLRKEYNEHWQETHTMLQNLRLQLEQQQRAQQENSYIKHQHQQLQDSFSKLVTDYKELQETFEAYRQQMERQGPRRARKETMEEINRLTAQVIAADEAILLRDEQIAKLRNESSLTSGLDEQVQVLKFQADVYKSDFTAEREARTKLAEEKTKLVEEREKLFEELQALREENRVLREEQEGYNQRQISDLQRRHRGSGNFEGPNRLRATPPLAHDYRQQAGSPVSGGYRTMTGNTPSHTPPRAEEEDLRSLQEYECPSCQAKFPDIDSLQLHVPDCIDNNSINHPF